MTPEMVQHSVQVAGNQNAAFTGRTVQEFGIIDAVQSRLAGRSKVYRWFPSPDGLDNGKPEIVVR
jgi:hypothetical protein